MSSKFACCGVLWGEFIAGLSGEASWKGLLGESSTQWLPDLAEQDAAALDSSDSESFEPSVGSGTT